MGDFSGTYNMFVNGVSTVQFTGMKYHTTAGLGWRSLGPLFYLHDSNTTGAPYSLYMKNVKMFVLA